MFFLYCNTDLKITIKNIPLLQSHKKWRLYGSRGSYDHFHSIYEHFENCTYLHWGFCLTFKTFCMIILADLAFHPSTLGKFDHLCMLYPCAPTQNLLTQLNTVFCRPWKYTWHNSIVLFRLFTLKQESSLNCRFSISGC